MQDGIKPSGAVAEMLAAEHEERPFGVCGEMLAAPDPLPPPPAEPARFPPPDWHEEALERQQAARAQADREAAAEAAAEAERKLQAEIQAVDDPQPLRRRGWMRTR